MADIADTPLPEHLERYALEHTRAEPELLLELIEQTYEQMGFPGKLSGRLIGRTLKMLCAIHQPQRVLEIGMFTGYSALSMAEAIPEDGRILCCETNPRAIEFAQQFFARSPHGHKIEVAFGRALDTLDKLEGPLDFSFIDADKANYLNYYQAVKARTRVGGLIVLDNMLWQGKVFAPESAKDQVVIDTNRIIAEDPEVENVFLTVADGLNVVRKVSGDWQ